MILLLILALAPAATDSQHLSRETFNRVNAVRQGEGLAPLRWDNAAAEEARRHCAAISSGQRPFGHDGFADRIGRLRRLLRIRSGAENVGSVTPEGAPARWTVELWLRSPGHRGNMLGDYQAGGVGVSQGPDRKICVTQIFLGLEPARK